MFLQCGFPTRSHDKTRNISEYSTGPWDVRPAVGNDASQAPTGNTMHRVNHNQQMQATFWRTFLTFAMNNSTLRGWLMKEPRITGCGSDRQ